MGVDSGVIVTVRVRVAPGARLELFTSSRTSPPQIWGDQPRHSRGELFHARTVHVEAIPAHRSCIGVGIRRVLDPGFIDIRASRATPRAWGFVPVEGVVHRGHLVASSQGHPRVGGFMDMSTLMVYDGARSPWTKGNARVYDFRFRVKFMASPCMAWDMEFLQWSFLHKPRGMLTPSPRLSCITSPALR
jgi:hypothetical protein